MNPGQTVLTLLLVLIVVLTQGYLHMKVSFFNSKVKTLLKNWRTLPDGFSRPIDSSGKLMTKRPRKPKNLFRINTLDELHEKIRLGYRVNDLDVRGDIHNHLLNTSEIHPVVQLMHDRKASFSTPNNRTDSCKVAIALEGGGMRGCVNAGMITVSEQGQLDIELTTHCAVHLIA
ncbi:hypothetical protein EON65_05065 [archaeon]|nr:MAG: hypothetical protein EON65_05065 [archaeon]